LWQIVIILILAISAEFHHGWICTRLLQWFTWKT